MLNHRNKLAIQQYARFNHLSHRTGEVFGALDKILPVLGEQSQSRQMINRIGRLLLHDRVTIVAPSCPDYSHRNGIYTFESVRDGVPLLARLHCKFLNNIERYIPSRVTCEIMIADQEAEDEVLCSRLRVTEQEFKKRIDASVEATREFVPDGWQVHKMMTMFPDLSELETKFSLEIQADRNLAYTIELDTYARMGMYQKIGVYDLESMRRRTLRTAAQYCALGYIAKRDGLLICNHNTVNLAWYNTQGVAILHNAVSIY